MLHDDYFAYTSKYKKLYGENMLVLIEVGSFFEAYSIAEEGANANEICGLLNIQSTRKNKSLPESRSNPIMFGFPTPVLNKFLAILMQHGYTVVLVEQITSPPNPRRDVTQVISPSTYTSSNDGVVDNRFLMCIYFGIGYDRHRRLSYLCISASLADVTTGASFILEDEAHGDYIRVTQDAERIINMHRPRELLICCDPDIVDSTKKHLRTWIENMRSSTCIHDQTHLSFKDAQPFQTPAYQCSVLRKAFPNTGLLSPIEHVDLATRWYALISYVHLINFLYQHNETLIQRMRRPTIIASKTRMLLANNAIEHLNILPASTGRDHKCGSILQLLNVCVTAMGRRMFRTYLTSPLTDKSAIESRYVLIESFMTNNVYSDFIPILRRIQDIERLYRRLQLNQLQPSEMESLLKSLIAVKDAHTMIKSLGELQITLEWTNEDASQLTSWINDISSRWDINAMASNEENFYVNGIYPNIDILSSTVVSHSNHFKAVIDSANKIVGPDATDFKLDKSADRDDYIITITKRRYDAYLQLIKNKTDAYRFEERPVSASNKTMLRLTYTGQVERQSQLHASSTELKDAVREAYLCDLATYDSQYFSLVEKIVSFVSNLDVIVACAKNAITHKYVRPIILSSTINSCINSKGLRHPLIEVIQTDVPYVPNDISIGGESSPNGMLVFGINASGKSSLMKALGINLIMAQAGMYVAANDFSFVPYEHVFTRIPGGDNLFRAQSTFVAEMSELRTILQHATNRSLIIGDELASGSESVSAISIVAAGIITLAKRGASFIFATHLHEVAQLEVIQALESTVKVFHMRVTYDTERDILIYDRRLQPGVGDTLYGLEVCKSLDLPPDFLLLANTIRQSHLKMSPTVVSNKKSRYSAQVFVDICSACKKPAQEVHHIKEQMHADVHGYIDAIHKNSPHNLIAVCSTCHDAIHAKTINVQGYVSTSMGIKLLTSLVDVNSTVSPKDVDDAVLQIQTLRDNGKSIAVIAKMVQLSEYKIRKILRG